MLGIFGTQDFVGSDEPRFQISQGYPTRDFISAGLHADEELTSDLNDFVARVDEAQWYLATLSYDGYHKKQTDSADTPYSQSTILYLDDEKQRGNAIVNIGRLPKYTYLEITFIFNTFKCKLCVVDRLSIQCLNFDLFSRKHHS